MNQNNPSAPALDTRVYALDPMEMTQEQMAVTFAMTSRNPRPFDEIAQEVTETKAADFHEKWVLGYGHSSVAEHAVLHIAVENISRIACDTLEDNRLASYTEKSSRYQVMSQGGFHTPEELAQDTPARETFQRTCNSLIEHYRKLMDSSQEYLRMANPPGENETTAAHRLRIRRIATDACRAVLPAAILTNVGITANARVFENMVSKLMSSSLPEERKLGETLVDEGRKTAPTLLKHAGWGKYLHDTMRREHQITMPMGIRKDPPEQLARLLQHDTQAVHTIAEAIMFQQFPMEMERVRQTVHDMTQEDRLKLIESRMRNIGDHDPAIREFELVNLTLELQMDYGAYREFRRHRMQSCFPQPLTTDLGYRVPPVLLQAGLRPDFEAAMQTSEQGYRELMVSHSQNAQYLVTHAHHRRLIVRMNLREAYNLFKLRTSRMAHESIREPILQAMKLALEVHPELFRWLRLRDQPGWWPY